MREILERAEAVARDRRAREVSTADLVLAIAEAAPGPARTALEAGGVCIDDVPAHREAMAGPSDRRAAPGVLAPASELVAALVSAERAAARAGPAGPGASVARLLEAALAPPDGWASRVIRTLGGDPGVVREVLERAAPPPPRGDAPPHEEPAVLPGLCGELRAHHDRLSRLEARQRDLQDRTDALISYLRVVYVVSLLLLGLSAALAWKVFLLR